MLFININNKLFFVKKNISILEACKFVGITIPRFCYHETLSVSGNCRMCLVELETNPNKPISSCTLPISDDIHILTETPFVKKARENVLETLLLNHPLDCPICDQAGECDLQDQAKNYGIKSSRYFFTKRSVEDKFLGSLVKTIMTRCIHCTRCVRFSDEHLGEKFLGTLNRGHNTEIGTYISSIFNSNMSGNVIDLCPVGALTSKSYAFKARPWELKVIESIDLTDSVGSKIFISVKESEIFRIAPKKTVQQFSSFISDKARFSFDAVNFLRINDPYLRSDLYKNSFANNSNWTKTNWFYLSQKFTFLNKKNLFVISEDLDFQFLLRLSQLQYTGNFFVKSLEKFNSLSNLYISHFFSSILTLNSKSSTCFLFSSDLKIENAIINIKLRSIFLKMSTKVFSSGVSSILNYPNLFLSFNYNGIANLLEAKLYYFSFLIIDNLESFFLFGTSFKFRFLKLNFFYFLKKLIPTIKILFLNKSSNTEAMKYLNISSLNTNVLKKTQNIFSIDLSETLFLNKTFVKYSSLKIFFWVNSHGPSLFNFFNFLLPLATLFERDGVFINIEGKSQNAYTSIIHSNITSLDAFLNNLKITNVVKKANSAFSFFFDLSLGYITLSDTFLLNPKKFIFFVNFFKKYPFKPIFEDFYRIGNLPKNSVLMYKRSKELRACSNNFF